MKTFLLVLLSLAVLPLVSCGTDHPSPTQPMGATPTPVPGVHAVNVGQGGNNFVDSQSGTSTTTIQAGQTVQWVWVGGTHSTTSGNCCAGDGKWDSGVLGAGMFTRMFPSTGTFPYFCSVHGSVMTGTIVVNP
ncbi:MAG: cupredoxin domain-containing protein [Thermoanaerobaculia bacterium]